jgi:nucleotide-binding universal stress UspA family protein
MPVWTTARPGTVDDVAFEIGTDGIGGLVVGFDGSGPSHDALAFSAGIARRNGARLIVVYAVDPAAEAIATLATGAGGVVEAAAAATVDHVRADARHALEGLDIAWDFVCARGDPATALEHVAAEQRIDAIVVGRSRSRMHRHIGSVAARLLRTAQRPVAVVP